MNIGAVIFIISIIVITGAILLYDNAEFNRPRRP